MNVAMILAGGVGARMGAGIPKQFIEVFGKPIMAYTLERYQASDMVDVIEVVCHKDYLNRAKKIVEDYSITKVMWIVEGGDSFPASTMNGFMFLRGKISPNDVVLVTSSVSPIVTDEVIEDCFKVAKEHENAMAVQEMIWSTCLKDDETKSSRAITRETMVNVQFPIAFRLGYICDAYDKVKAMGLAGKMELHLQYIVFAVGGTMYFSKGDHRSIKITTPEDLDLFKGYLLLKKFKEDGGDAF